MPTHIYVSENNVISFLIKRHAPCRDVTNQLIVGVV